MRNKIIIRVIKKGIRNKQRIKKEKIIKTLEKELKLIFEASYIII
jgi:hypothetical protein